MDLKILALAPQTAVNLSAVTIIAMTRARTLIIARQIAITCVVTRFVIAARTMVTAVLTVKIYVKTFTVVMKRKVEPWQTQAA